MVNRTAIRIVRNHGIDALRTLIECFEHNLPLADAARKIGVTRQQVHKWKQRLGYEFPSWRPNSSVLDVLEAFGGEDNEA